MTAPSFKVLRPGRHSVDGPQMYEIFKRERAHLGVVGLARGSINPQLLEFIHRLGEDPENKDVSIPGETAGLLHWHFEVWAFPPANSGVHSVFTSDEAAIAAYRQAVFSSSEPPTHFEETKEQFDITKAVLEGDNPDPAVAKKAIQKWNGTAMDLERTGKLLEVSKQVLLACGAALKEIPGDKLDAYLIGNLVPHARDTRVHAHRTGGNMHVTGPSFLARVR